MPGDFHRAFLFVSCCRLYLYVSMKSNAIPNKLIHESSPYLLQHAYNPVQWYPWGEEALQLAIEKNLPILVSIGYSACHWCHVMEKESFEDENTAAFMNRYFINIKIDREERPDLDHLYMDALHAINGSGGWPLNVFLTPDKKPFFGGTYFPPKPAYNRPCWLDVLYSMSEYWKNKREEILQQADTLTKHLQQSNEINFKPGFRVHITDEDLYNKSRCKSIADAILKNADKKEGGFGTAPKFLQTFSIQYLIQYAHLSASNEYKEQPLLSLQKMIKGGIYDQLGGGISRYSTDKEWLVPHFEKMLYDNALLTISLCDAYSYTNNELYKEAIEHTLNFVTTELHNPAGGYYTALDADSEGVEGKYYVWQKNEIDLLLGESAAIFCDYYNVTDAGNWEHTNILNCSKEPQQMADEFNISLPEFKNTINNCNQLLLTYRKKRIAPTLDDKILLSCNALLLKAFCKAYASLQIEQYKIAAIDLYQFIELNFIAKGSILLHTYKNGEAKLPAFLDDYAYYIDALIALQEITADVKYLFRAKEYLIFLEENFSDEDHCFFYFTSLQQKDIVVRKKELFDGATPSANAIMCSNLFYLASIFDHNNWRKRAEKMLATMVPAIENYAGSFSQWAIVYLQQSFEINEIVITGNNFMQAYKEILGQFIPNKLLLGAQKGDKPELVLLKNKLFNNDITIYLCRNYACLQPVYTIKELLNSIK